MRSKYYWKYFRILAKLTVAPGHPSPMNFDDPSQVFQPRLFAPAGDRLFFSFWNLGQEVWRSDGTAEGTFRLRDVNPDWTNGCIQICPDYPQFLPVQLCKLPSNTNMTMSSSF